MSDLTISSENAMKKVLGRNNFRGLFAFFKEILCHKHKGTLYISFVTRRCSCLAFLFLQLFAQQSFDGFSVTWENDGHLNVKIENDEGKCCLLTDGSFVDLGGEIGRNICHNTNANDLPEIILVDDSISYGRSISSAMDLFTNRITDSIYSELKKTQQNTDEKIQQSLNIMEEYRSSKISICVYAQKKQTALLPPLYQTLYDNGKQLLDQGKTIELSHAQWNDYSIRLSELISCADVANAAFVMSVGIDHEIQNPSGCDHEDSDNCQHKAWKKTAWQYRDHREIIWFYPLPSLESRSFSAVCSVRRIECGYGHRYRLIPFLFMPVLTDGQFHQLERFVFEKLRSAELISDSYEKIRPDLDEKLTNHTRMDFITTYLSQSVLCCFCRNLPTWDTEQCDRLKIAWNYSGVHLPDSVGSLPSILEKICLSGNQSSLASMDEIAAWFKSLNCELPFMENRPIPSEWNNMVIDFQNTKYLQEIEKWNGVIEEMLFQMDMNFEKRAHEAVMSNERLGTFSFKQLNTYRFRTFYDYHRELDAFTEKKNLARKISTLELLSASLSFMDAGVISVVSDFDNSNHLCTPRIRLCEQAMSSQPRRFYCHTDALIVLEQHSWWTEAQGVDYLKQYIKRLMDSNLISASEATGLCNSLYNFYKSMCNGGQQLRYWSIGLNRHFRVSSPGTAIEEISSRELRRRSLQFGESAYVN